jgi:hypothetical protein
MKSTTAWLLPFGRSSFKRFGMGHDSRGGSTEMMAETAAIVPRCGDIEFDG